MIAPQPKIGLGDLLALSPLPGPSIPGCLTEAESKLVVHKFRIARMQVDGELTTAQADYLYEHLSQIHWAFREMAQQNADLREALHDTLVTSRPMQFQPKD